MKRIIYFLAKISGVKSNIEKETAKRIGNDIRSEARWFSGLYYGTVIDELKPMEFILKKVGNDIRNSGTLDAKQLREVFLEYLNQKSNRNQN